MFTLRFTLTRAEVVKTYRRRMQRNRLTWRFVYMGIVLILSPTRSERVFRIALPRRTA